MKECLIKLVHKEQNIIFSILMIIYTIFLVTMRMEDQYQ